MKGGYVYIMLYILTVVVHFAIWKYSGLAYEDVFKRYYLFLSMLFMLVVTVLSIVKRIYPDYVGFTFLGLIMFKLSMILLAKNRLGLEEVPSYKIHFILPYLLALVWETLFAISLIKGSVKDEKNQ